MPRLLRAAVAACVALSAGCRPEGVEKLVSASGTVTRGGKPVAGLGLNFVPESGSLRSFAKTDESGRFTLVAIDGRPGAAPGPHRVWVQVPPADASKPGAKPAAGDPDLGKLLRKYGSPEASPLVVRVTPDAPLDIALD